MPDDHQNKPWYLQLPAVLTGVVAFLVTVSTLFINIRNISVPKPVPATVATVSPTVASSPTAAALPQRTTLQLRLDRIEVLRDGSFGDTHWAFEVEADGRPLFELPARAYSNEENRSMVVPEAGHAQGRVRMFRGDEVFIKVSGKQGGRIQGAGALTSGGEIEPIRVTSGSNGPAFVFHFSATPVKAGEG